MYFRGYTNEHSLLRVSAHIVLEQKYHEENIETLLQVDNKIRSRSKLKQI